MKDSNKYYLTDQETGEKYSVTKEYYEHYQLFFEQVKKEFIPESFKGKLVIVGIGTDFDREEFKKLWFESDNFKTIEFKQ